jgi:hypothetical protein
VSLRLLKISRLTDFPPKVIEADYNRNVTVTLAEGQSNYFRTTQLAKATALENRIKAESQSLEKVAAALGIAPSDKIASDKLIAYQQFLSYSNLQNATFLYGVEKTNVMWGNLNVAGGSGGGGSSGGGYAPVDGPGGPGSNYRSSIDSPFGPGSDYSMSTMYADRSLAGNEVEYRRRLLSSDTRSQQLSQPMLTAPRLTASDHLRNTNPIAAIDVPALGDVGGGERDSLLLSAAKSSLIPSEKEFLSSVLVS